MPVFPEMLERLRGNLLSVDGSATQLFAIVLAILLDVDALKLRWLKSHHLKLEVRTPSFLSLDDFFLAKVAEQTVTYCSIII